MTENITVFKHNSIKITTDVGAVYIDPFQIDEESHDAAFILITHDHYDHFSAKDIRRVAAKETVLVVPDAMEEKTGEVADLVSRIETVTPGDTFNIGGLELETVPMYNILKPFHPRKAGWVGYILTVNGQRIYIAGDIDLIKEARAVKCDVALVPVGGFYTMDATKAAKLVNEIKPSVAIPVHYGNLVGSTKDAEKFVELVKEPVKVEIKIR
ncbi:MAG: MBL fold metallo-hydrolase [Lachnospiraceae bacterium]|nr:MBL fold metallo-hydrolase [Lachnospiraceae bacterium]